MARDRAHAGDFLLISSSRFVRRSSWRLLFFSSLLSVWLCLGSHKRKPERVEKQKIELEEKKTVSPLEKRIVVVIMVML